MAVKLVGKIGIIAAALSMAGASSVLGASYITGGDDTTPNTGFTAGHDLTGYAWVQFYWNGSTTGQFKQVWDHRNATGDASLYYGDSNSFYYDGFFDPNVDSIVGMECYLASPNWGSKPQLGISMVPLLGDYVNSLSK